MEIIIIEDINRRFAGLRSMGIEVILSAAIPLKKPIAGFYP